MLVGDPGVGKTSTAEGRADMGALGDGTCYRGDLGKLIAPILDEMRNSDEFIVSFVD
jgi:ATP-dependent Clp protease ATP-binding subunit ClpA